MRASPISSQWLAVGNCKHTSGRGEVPCGRASCLEHVACAGGRSLAQVGGASRRWASLVLLARGLRVL